MLSLAVFKSDEKLAKEESSLQFPVWFWSISFCAGSVAELEREETSFKETCAIIKGKHLAWIQDHRL